MSKLNDRILGHLILTGSLLGIIGYFYILFLSSWTLLAIQISAFVAVSAMLAIIAWIGYTLATTPPPMPLEAFEDTVEEEKEA